MPWQNDEVGDGGEWGKMFLGVANVQQGEIGVGYYDFGKLARDRPPAGSFRKHHGRQAVPER